MAEAESGGSYTMQADDVEVWKGDRMPSQRTVDHIAREASARGWNGTTLELWHAGQWIRDERPSGEALS